VAEQEKTNGQDGGAKYRRFMAMIGTSTFVMFLLMYFNTFSADHIFFSETRFWMAFVMGAAMAVVMLLFMLSMYRDRTRNLVILGVAIVTFSGALWLVRSQTTIDDSEYMKAMIPHHSIAIMTSERAHIRDPRVRELAKAIIVAQRREIAEMKYLIADIEANGIRGEERMPTDAELALPAGGAQ
jgi:multisubunit Na+/H+ antiporter MnhB subunit